MKRLKFKGLAMLGLAVIGLHSYAIGLSSITDGANNYQIIFLNKTVTFVSTDWSMLTNYYNQNSTFPQANAYAIDTSFLPGVTSITNTASGTLEVKFGATAPGPMAGNGFALAPTRVSLRGVFYVYELVQCFTNITDSMTNQEPPQQGTLINLFSKSALGTNCMYASDPYTAAVNQVNGVT
jgi:hypothetical protein